MAGYAIGIDSKKKPKSKCKKSPGMDCKENRGGGHGSGPNGRADGGLKKSTAVLTGLGSVPS